MLLDHTNMANDTVRLEADCEVYRVALDEEERIPLSAIQTVKPNITGLFYWEDFSRILLTRQEDKFFPPADCWGQKIYICLPSKHFVFVLIRDF